MKDNIFYPDLAQCDPGDGTCPYVCGMGGDAGKNEHFVALLNCMVENDCMEKYEPSGSCLAEDSQALDTKGRTQRNDR